MQISNTELEGIFRQFLTENGYVSRRPVDLILAVEKVQLEIEKILFKKALGKCAETGSL